MPLDFHELMDCIEEEMSMPLAWCSGEGTKVRFIMTAKEGGWVRRATSPIINFCDLLIGYCESCF